MTTAPQEIVFMGKADRMLAEAATLDEVKHILGTANAARGNRQSSSLSAIGYPNHQSVLSLPFHSRRTS
jgi:hypothetical protein